MIAGLFAILVNSRQPEELVYTDLALIPGYRRPLSGDFQMATVTIKFQNSLNWYIWFTSTSYWCWLNPLKTQAIFIILAALVIKHVQRVLPKLQAKRAISLVWKKKDMLHKVTNNFFTLSC